MIYIVLRGYSGCTDCKAASRVRVVFYDPSTVPSLSTVFIIKSYAPLRRQQPLFLPVGSYVG